MQQGFQRGPCGIGGTMQTRPGELLGQTNLDVSAGGGLGRVGHPVQERQDDWRR